MSTNFMRNVNLSFCIPDQECKMSMKAASSAWKYAQLKRLLNWSKQKRTLSSSGQGKNNDHDTSQTETKEANSPATPNRNIRLFRKRHLSPMDRLSALLPKSEIKTNDGNESNSLETEISPGRKITDENKEDALCKETTKNENEMPLSPNSKGLGYRYARKRLLSPTQRMASLIGEKYLESDQEGTELFKPFKDTDILKNYQPYATPQSHQNQSDDRFKSGNLVTVVICRKGGLRLLINMDCSEKCKLGKGGYLRHDELIQSSSGDFLTNNLGQDVFVFRPNLEDYISAMPKGSVVMAPQVRHILNSL